jgi:Transposase DNA-binding
MSWAAKEMNGANLGDERLNRRVIRVLERLGEKPSVSIPTACGGWAETQAAYRFFDNEKVSAEAVLAPHVEATLVRCRNQAVVLCVDDTTELDFTGKNDIVGLGPLSYEAQRGLYLHLTLAVTAERLALGVLAALPWARDPADYGNSAQHSHRPIDEKESIRWLESYRAVSELDRANPNTQFVYAADREGDIYEIFAEAAKRPDSADFLIRSQHNRNLASGAKLRSEVAKREALGDVEFDLMARPGRPARRVVATLRAARVRLKCPTTRSFPTSMSPCCTPSKNARPKTPRPSSGSCSPASSSRSSTTPPNSSNGTSVAGTSRSSSASSKAAAGSKTFSSSTLIALRPPSRST